MNTREIADAAGMKIKTFFGYTFMYKPIQKKDENIYLMYDKYFKRYKIGVTSKNVKERAKQIERASGTEMQIVNWFYGCKLNEKKLHEALKPYKLKGEWYRLDDKVLEIFDECSFRVLCGYGESILTV